MISRIANLFRGFFSLFVSGMERRNPEALLELEKENLRKQISRYNDGLASHAGLCERLITQVKKLEGEERDLRARTSANLKAGNRDLAGQLAMRLATVQREMEENRKQAQSAEETYRNLVTARDVSIKAAKDKIESLRTSINDLKVKRAMAELTEMASGMVAEIGGSGDTLDRLHTMVEEDREKAAGRVRVAKDNFNTSDIQIKESEQKALADQALADFAAREGIALEPQASTQITPETTESSSPSRVMGPAVTDGTAQ
ncbi:MAG TPA: PspA/IM30 family protein [Tepidisphaeraceae bacterium]|jgi:phage shock protein A